MNKDDMDLSFELSEAQDQSQDTGYLDEDLYDTPFGPISEKEVKAARDSSKSEGDRQEELSLHFGKGLTRFFRSKTGDEFVAVKIPGTEFPSWPEFVVPARNVHDNRYGKGYWMKISSSGNTRLTYSVPREGKDGKRSFERKTVFVSNQKLKDMVESYKKREPEERAEEPAESNREPDDPHRGRR